MHLCIAPKIVIRVFTVLTLTASLICALSFRRTSRSYRGSALAHQDIGQNVDERPLSPRLSALRDRIKSGDGAALDNFWKEIEARGCANC
jgi:hypothetical protein